VLILGSAFNPATARGMSWQLQCLAESAAPGTEVIVAGPESERVLADHARTGVTLLGRVSREKLLALLESCSVLLIHTFGGAGAVTRIPEALLSGIPVVANPNGARDQFGTPGVHIYASPGEFAALLASPLPIPPEPPPPADAAARFRSTLERLAETFFR
jgi:glycosyltransferase involved in cell wall biosynthesis